MCMYGCFYSEQKMYSKSSGVEIGGRVGRDSQLNNRGDSQLRTDTKWDSKVEHGKENRPLKQGGVYSLALGKNDGPFLQKDIMFNNPKSIQLLVGSEIVNSHITLAKALEEFDARKRKEQMALKDSFMKEEKGCEGLAQNIIDYSAFIQNELTCLKKGVGELGSQQRRFKGQLEDLQKRINLQNNGNMAEMIPQLRFLYNTVKKSFCDEKDKMYWLTRELEDVSASGHRIQLQMRQCEERLCVVEKTVGVKREPFDELPVDEMEEETQEGEQ